MKLARKLIVAVVAAILSVHAISVFLRVERQKQRFELDMTRYSRVTGGALAHAVERAWRTRGEQDALEILEHATREEDHLAIRWVWLEPDAEPAHAPVTSLEALAPVLRGEPLITRFGDGERVALYAYTPVKTPTDRAGAIEIANPLADERAYMQHAVYHASVAALAIVLLCGALTWSLGIAFIGRPVQRLVMQARAIGGGDLDRRSSVRSKDELGELAREMDAMAEQLRLARTRLESETESRLAAVEQLRHAERLTTVGELASGIAHELGTPINVVQGHADAIEEGEHVDDRTRQRASVISRQCDRMAGIIRQLLDFARRGREGDGASVRAVDAVDHTLDLLEPMIRKKRLDVSVVEADEEATAAISMGRLQQVLANVVMNAIDATPEGGRIAISVARACTEERAEGGSEEAFVAIDVEDSGHGMSPETARRVFEPFFTTKDVGEGTGLGLSVTHGIVEDHGGWIDLTSVPGGGSTLRIRLPERERA